MLHVASALADLNAAGVALYSDQQAIDSTTPMRRAMIQGASALGEQERQIIRSRVLAGLDRVRQQGKKLGRPKVSSKTEEAIRRHLSAGDGILRVAALVGVGSGTVQRVRREMAEELAEVALPLWDRQPQHDGVCRPQQAGCWKITQIKGAGSQTIRVA